MTAPRGLAVRSLAAGSYGLHAILAFLIVIVANRMLPAGEYSRFSINLAAAQLAAVALYEWIRLAITRYRADRADTASVGAYYLSFALASVPVALAGALAGLIGGTYSLYALVAILVAGQGATDLMLAMFRIRGQFTAFTVCQIGRSSGLLVGLAAGLSFAPSALSGFAGMACGYAVATTLAAILSGRPRFGAYPAIRRELIRHWHYGSRAAIAALAHISVPFLLRKIAILALGLREAAGIMFAIDLLQRPFVLLASALNGVLYPDVVHEHADRGSGSVVALRRLYSIIVPTLVIAAAVMLAVLPDIAIVVVKPEQRPIFMLCAFPITLMFLLRAILQTPFAIRLHLEFRMGRLFVNALADVILTAGVASAVMLMLRVWGAGAGQTALGIATGAAVGAWLATLVARSSFGTHDRFLDHRVMQVTLVLFIVLPWFGLWHAAPDVAKLVLKGGAILIVALGAGIVCGWGALRAERKLR